MAQLMDTIGHIDHDLNHNLMHCHHKNTKMDNNNKNNNNNAQNQIIERSYHDKEKKIFGCKHYARNCYLLSACCGKWYVCRFCHDEQNEDYRNDIRTSNNNNNAINNHNNTNGIKPHVINRYSTKMVKCMQCGTVQTASKYCMNCHNNNKQHRHQKHAMITHKHKHKMVKNDIGLALPNIDDTDDDCDSRMGHVDDHKLNDDCNNENDDDCNDNTNAIGMDVIKDGSSLGRYCLGHWYCDICVFYDDNKSKKIFHCKECGLCRLGEKKDYVHCMRCGCCLNYKYYAKHPCIENSLKSDCPICFTFLFKSREPVTFFMPCGHPIHYSCLTDYAKVGCWKCPICRTPWYDEESEKRKRIVQAIKNHNVNNNDNNNHNNHGGNGGGSGSGSDYKFY